MRRRGLGLVLVLAGCTGAETRPATGAGTTEAAPAIEPPATPAAPATEAASPEPERELPPSIPMGASATTFDAEGRVTSSASSSDGEPAPWTRTELRPDPLPFSTDAIETTLHSWDAWEARSDRPATVRFCLEFRGFPADALFLELVPGASEVAWAEGPPGTITEIWCQGGSEGCWQVDFLTSAPPMNNVIRSLRFSMDLHQSTRVLRHEAHVGEGQAAAFDFGVMRERWVVSGPSMVTDFTAGAYGSPASPLYKRGLSAGRSTRIEDANGAAFTSWGGGGAGSQTISHMRCSAEGGARLPIKVTVDVPQETKTTRFSIHLKEMVPKWPR